MVDIETDSDGVCSVLTDRGDISTRHVVNAAGPFAGQVSKMLGVDLPIEAVRRQKIYATPQPEIPQDAPLCIDIGQEVYWRPSHGGAFLAWVHGFGYSARLEELSDQTGEYDHSPHNHL